MDYVQSLMIAIVLLLVASLAAVVATLSGRPAVRRIASRMTYGSCLAALIAVGLAVWLLYWWY
jgi:hypothetical protein